jgi:Na+/serine symporter
MFERVTLCASASVLAANIDLIRRVLHSPLLLLLFAGSFQAACVFVVMDLRQPPRMHLSTHRETLQRKGGIHKFIFSLM